MMEKKEQWERTEEIEYYLSIQMSNENANFL